MRTDFQSYWQDVCAPVEILHLTEGKCLDFSKMRDFFFFFTFSTINAFHTGGNNDEEPTFILTLYEIPVTPAYLPSSSNDSVMTSDLPTVETPSSLGFSDQAHTLPSTSESSRLVSPGMFLKTIRSF